MWFSGGAAVSLVIAAQVSTNASPFAVKNEAASLGITRAGTAANRIIIRAETVGGYGRFLDRLTGGNLDCG